MNMSDLKTRYEAAQAAMAQGHHLYEEAQSLFSRGHRLIAEGHDKLALSEQVRTKASIELTTIGQEVMTKGQEMMNPSIQVDVTKDPKPS